MGRDQNININRILEELDSNPHGWLWEVQDSNEGNNCRCGGKSKRTRLEVESEYVTELESEDVTEIV